MPEHHLYGLVLVIILALMFIVIFVEILLISTPTISQGWLSLLIDYVLKGLWPIK